jgi:hypothetical protein
MLIHLGFFVKFVNWVFSCLTQVSFSILTNGSTSIFFRPGRGLRKGCPLFPLLFLIVVEGLSRALIYVKRLGPLKGIRLGISVSLSHFLFVDDILLFCNGSKRDALELKDILDLYCMAIGMKVNIGKSSISFIGVN